MKRNSATGQSLPWSDREEEAIEGGREISKTLVVIVRTEEAFQICPGRRRRRSPLFFIIAQLARKYVLVYLWSRNSHFPEDLPVIRGAKWPCIPSYWQPVTYSISPALWRRSHCTGPLDHSQSPWAMARRIISTKRTKKITFFGLP